MKEIERFCDVSILEVALHAVQLSGNQFQILTSRPTQLTIASTEGAKVETIQGVHLLTLTETCPKANTPDHFFVRNPHVVSSQQLIPLPLIHDATEWLKEIQRPTKMFKEVFKELKKDHAGHVPMDKFKYRVTHHQTIKYRGWIMYLQLALTIFGVVVIAYKAASLSISFIFPFIRRLLSNKFSRKRDRVQQYRVIRHPSQDIELHQRIRPSAPADSSNP